MAPVEADSLCDLCGKAADPEAEECVGVTCVARCHHPKEQDVYHTDCLKKYLRSFSRHQDISRYSGFVCPRGKGRGTSAKQPCTSKVSHSQKIIIRSKKSTAVVPDAAAANAPDTTAANDKARNGKKKGADAGPAATATAPAPKPTKPKLPTLNSLPRRFASEPYLPTEYVQLPPAPEPVRKDPLGRNTAAAAAASAKAAKKNAKRALARQRKQEEQEQQTGQQSGSAAAAAAHTALGDGWTAARGTGAAATAAASAAAAANAEQEEWEEWEGNEHTDTDAQYAAHGDLHDVLYAGGFGAQFVAEGSWQDTLHRQESDASAHTFAAFVPADEASDSPTHGSAATGMGASGVSSTEPLPGPTAHKEPAALAPSAGVAAAAVTTMHPAPSAVTATSAAGTARTPLSSAVTDTTLCHNYSQHQQAATSAAGAGAAAAASSGLYESASARTYPTAQQQQQPQSVHTTTSSTTAVPSHTTPMQNISWMRQQLLQADYSSAPAAPPAAPPTAMQTAAGTAQQLLQANYSSAPAVAAASMAMQTATVPSAIPTSGFFPSVAARGGAGALTAASSFTSLQQQQQQQQYKMSAISAPPLGYSTGYSAPAPMHSAGHYGTATAAAPAGSVQWTQQYYQGLGATALAAATGYSGGIYAGASTAAAPTAAAVGSGADADGEETLDDMLKILGV